jgi:murein DD-endopeptidase MepM/ murein hydrolase activator NlpD
MIAILNKCRDKLPMAAVALLIVAVFLVWFFGVQTSAYAVHINGEEKFFVKSAQEFESVKAQIEEKYQKKYDCEMKVTDEIKISKVRVNKGKIISEKELAEALFKELEIKAPAASIVVDGKVIANVKNKATAEQILKQIKQANTIVAEGEELLECKFVEKVAIKDTMVEPDDLLSQKDAYTLIVTGCADPQKYIVEEGDNLWLIARRNDMYVDDIVKANNLKTENLSLGQELILVKSKPYINVASVVKGEKVERIPYETEVITDKSSPYSVRVRQNGQDGEKHIAYKAKLINGILKEREITKEDITKKPVNKVIVKGTQVMQVASRGGGGSLMWPLYGSISQYYRGGHSGIDIAVSSGTPIKAADGGYVTFAGWQGGYGKFVIVNHGNGIVTRYAHCSSLAVSSGQRVSAGQVIAYSGSTGRSTGPHLHFEVMVNGGFRNPLSYLQ